MPFEAGITRVDGQQVLINILGVDPDDTRGKGLDMVVGYRICQCSGSTMAHSKLEENQQNPSLDPPTLHSDVRRQVSKSVIEFISQMAAEGKFARNLMHTDTPALD